MPRRRMVGGDCALVDASALEALAARFEWIPRWQTAVNDGTLRLFWTHLTLDEVAELPDVDRRKELLTLGAALCRLVVTGAMVWDFSRWEYATMESDAQALEAFHQGDLRGTKDALLCTTAERKGWPLVTENSQLTERALGRGLEVLTPSDVQSLLLAL